MAYRSKEKAREYARKYQAKRTEYIKYWHEWHPEKSDAIKRRGLAKKYGLTLEEYDEMLHQREVSGCDICGGPPNGQGRYHVDHDHDSGKVRGMLCHSCNVSFDQFLKHFEGFLRYALSACGNPPC